MRQDSILLEFRPSAASSSTSTFSFRLPNIAVQGGTPVITQLDSFSTSSGPSFFLFGGTRTMIGKFLAPYPLLPSLTLVLDPSQIPTVPISPLNIQLAGTTGTTAPASPIVKFGQNDLVVRSARYFPTAVRRTELGADSVFFDMFNFTDTVSKTFTVTTPSGSVNVPNVLAVHHDDRVHPAQVLEHQTVVVSDRVLLQGATYEVGGVALILANSGSVMHSAAMRLNGQTLPPVQPLSPPRGARWRSPCRRPRRVERFETRAGAVLAA
jgi:hypothetical protein